jgi:hypothetical protein
MVIALLALFVALGGPAEAARLVNGKLLKKGSVTGKAIKDRSLTTRDLSKAAVRKLQATPRGSVTETALANGAVTPGKIARGAVSSGAIAPGGVSAGNLAAGSVGSGQVADGSLGANDVARFWGSFTIDLPAIGPRSCWSGVPTGRAPERAGADIRGDVVLVTPTSRFPERTLTFMARTQALDPARPETKSQFVLAVCNPTDGPQAALASVSFNYVVIDVP